MGKTRKQSREATPPTAVRLPAAHPRIIQSSAMSARELLAECSRSLTEPGFRLCGLTMCQFSLLDLVIAVLEAVGPADVAISTWTAGIRDAEAASWLVENEVIKRFWLLTDASFPHRQPGYCARITERFGADAIVQAHIHAKFALIRNDNARIAIRSSMNLNTNTRIEQFDLDNCATLSAWLWGFIENIRATTPLGFDAPRPQITAATARALGDVEELPEEPSDPAAEERERKLVLARKRVSEARAAALAKLPEDKRKKLQKQRRKRR